MIKSDYLGMRVYDSCMSGTLHTGIARRTTSGSIPLECTHTDSTPGKSIETVTSERSDTPGRSGPPAITLLTLPCRDNTPREIHLIDRFAAVMSQHLSTGGKRGAILFIPIYITWAISSVRNSCG